MRRNVNSAIGSRQNSKKGPTKEVERALNELSLIVANSHGQYTNEVASFLNEISSSSVPDLIRDFVISGRSANPAFALFDGIFRTFPEMPFGSRQLFDGLVAAIETSINQNVKDRALLENIRGYFSTLNGRFEAIEASLSRKSDFDHYEDYSLYDTARLRVSSAINTENSKIKIETTEGQKSVDIGRIVVPARLRATDHRDPTPPEHERNRSAEFGIHYMVSTIHNAVVLGDPGGGKSTLTQYICYFLSRQFITDHANDDNVNNEYRYSCAPRLPLKVILRNLEKRQSSNASYNVLDYLVDDLRLHFDNNADETKRFVLRTLSSGQGVLLFDGLDEILDVSSRANIVSNISSFSKLYALCPSIVTSRVVGYRDAPMPDHYSAFILARFNRAEVQKFSTSMISSVRQIPVSEAEEQALRFVSQTEDSASDLRQNPLMLGLMVFLFTYKGDVPDNRPEIYRECTMLMFHKWDKNRGIDVGLASDFKLIDLFCHLSSQIFGDAETEEGVSNEWLWDNIFSFFNDWYSNKANATRATNKVVEFVTGRAWIMCAAGPSVFKFTHRTFLEYFFARYLTAATPEVGALIHNILMPKIIKAEWDVVSHLALQIVTFENHKQSISAAEILIDCIKTEHGPEDSLNLIMFASRSLEYISVPENIMRKLVYQIMDKALSFTATSDAIYTCARISLMKSGKRSTYVSHIINEYMINEYNSGGKKARKILFLVTDARNNFYGSRMFGFYDNAYSPVFKSLKPAREKIQSIIRDNGGCESGVRMARDLSLLDESSIRDSVQLFGWNFVVRGERGVSAHYQLPVLSIISRLTNHLDRHESKKMDQRSQDVVEICNELLKASSDELENLSGQGFTSQVCEIGAWSVARSIEVLLNITERQKEKFNLTDENVRSIISIVLLHAVLLDVPIERQERWHRYKEGEIGQRLLQYVQASPNSVESRALRIAAERAAPHLFQPI